MRNPAATKLNIWTIIDNFLLSLVWFYQSKIKNLKRFGTELPWQLSDFPPAYVVMATPPNLWEFDLSNQTEPIKNFQFTKNQSLISQVAAGLCLHCRSTYKNRNVNCTTSGLLEKVGRCSLRAGSLICTTSTEFARRMRIHGHTLLTPTSCLPLTRVSIEKLCANSSQNFLWLKQTREQVSLP